MDSTLEIETIEPHPRGWTSGPDDFEVRIGNWVAHAQPLWERGDAYERLRAQWLPYYDDALRERRLANVLMYLRQRSRPHPWSLERGDAFHAFDRLYGAVQEFVQALFIARRVYPVAYDKWLEQQLRDLLGLPNVAQRLADALAVERVREGAATVGGAARRVRQARVAAACSLRMARAITIRWISLVPS